MFINELLAHFHLLGVHWVGLGYFWDEGLSEVYGVVERSSGGEYSIFWFVEDLGIFGVLWGKFLFYFLHCLGKGGGKHKLPDMGMIFPKYSLEGSCIPLLCIDPSG